MIDGAIVVAGKDVKGAVVKGAIVVAGKDVKGAVVKGAVVIAAMSVNGTTAGVGDKSVQSWPNRGQAFFEKYVTEIKMTITTTMMIPTTTMFMFLGALK